jgi:hypothetical protein
MLNFNDYQDIISNKSFDEQSEDMMSFLNVSNFHFEECFTKIFSKDNLIDIDLDNEAENKAKKQIKNESNYSFSSKEKSCENTNSLNLNENNSEKTIDKSKETSQKNENLNEKSDVSNLSSISHVDEEKNNSSNNKLIISISDEDLKQFQNEDKGSDTLSFLGKKRILFEDFSPKDYSIFNYGEYNEFSKQIINEVLNEILEIDNKKMKEMMNGEHQKKVYKKRKNLPKRKDNSDNIRKKVKSRFLKVLKNAVNEKLKLAGSKKFFNFLPQTFVSNVSKDKNKDMFDSTFKDIFTKNFCEDKDGNQHF